MFTTMKAFMLDVLEANPVTVEADVHRGLPSFTIVGLPDAAVREARERVRAALVNCGFEFPLRRIVINIGPASLRKAGPSMDLALAAALLLASGQLDATRFRDTGFVGELGLDGSTRPVNGALAMAEAARAAGVRTLVLPSENAPEAALAGGIDLVPIDGVGRLADLARGDWKPVPPEPISLEPSSSPCLPDLADLRGQPLLHRTLEIAAAGGHSLLMVGPHGSGASLAATRLPSILPPLRAEERLEVLRVASAAGRVSSAISGARPFRAPHHTTSPPGLLGGGTPAHLGEVTLAHRGVLFLDQLEEFRRDALEALRAPLESGEISIARGDRSLTMPCRFMLVAAVVGSAEGSGCSAARLPHLSRLDAFSAGFEIAASIAPPSAAQIAGPPAESSAEVRARVLAARERQERRLGEGRTNSEMSGEELADCPRERDTSALFSAFLSRSRLRGLAVLHVLRVAQTLADMAGADSISREAMAEALQLSGAERA